MKEMLDRWGQGLKHRISMMVGRAVLSLVDDAGDMQMVQVNVLNGETLDQVEHFQAYGHTSVAPTGSEAVVLSLGGQRGNAIVVLVGDPRVRLKGLQPGESALYDDQAQKIVIERGQIHVVTTKDVRVECAKAIVQASAEVDVTAPKVVVTSNDVELGATGGAAVARVGDHVAGGVITTGSAKVKAA